MMKLRMSLNAYSSCPYPPSVAQAVFEFLVVLELCFSSIGVTGVYGHTQLLFRAQVSSEVDVVKSWSREMFTKWSLSGDLQAMGHALQSL